MTSSKPRITILKKNALHKILNRVGHMTNANCRECDIILRAGESIVTKKSSGWIKWYHEECARSKNII